MLGVGSPGSVTVTLEKSAMLSSLSSVVFWVNYSDCFPPTYSVFFFFSLCFFFSFFPRPLSAAFSMWRRCEVLYSGLRLLCAKNGGCSQQFCHLAINQVTGTVQNKVLYHSGKVIPKRQVLPEHSIS